MSCSNMHTPVALDIFIKYCYKIIIKLKEVA